MNILVTGAAGFIGYHLCRGLLSQSTEVVGVDNLNQYYDVGLKRDRLAQLTPHENFSFCRMDLADRTAVKRLFSRSRFDCVVHLAAQAGVRHSLENPDAYVDSNLVAFVNVLEGCRHHEIDHLVYASSSSVYGDNTKVPFAIDDEVNHPVSLYAATKRANELMAQTYSHLYGLQMTGLRFFTVYGPWGRPDMAIYRFTQAILAGKPIQVFNYGHMRRDFTYIDDIIAGVLGALDARPTATTSEVPSDVGAPKHRIYNLGNHQPVELGALIAALETSLGIKAKRKFLAMQPGDVMQTYADIDDSVRELGFRPQTSIESGIERFVAWYREYHEKKSPRRSRAA